MDVCWCVAVILDARTLLTRTGWTPDHHKKPLIDLKKAAHGKFVRQRMRETNVLVIDEISMVENLHFERLNAVMKEARESDQPFGGVQLIVTGDVSFCAGVASDPTDALSFVNCPLLNPSDTVSLVEESWYH